MQEIGDVALLEVAAFLVDTGHLNKDTAAAFTAAGDSPIFTVTICFLARMVVMAIFRAEVLAKDAVLSIMHKAEHRWAERQWDADPQ